MLWYSTTLERLCLASLPLRDGYAVVSTSFPRLQPSHRLYFTDLLDILRSMCFYFPSISANSNGSTQGQLLLTIVHMVLSPCTFQAQE